jgi:RND superfamily putative drug exporter
MSLLAAIVAGRRSKWVVIAAWIAALGLLSPLIGRFESAQRNEPSSFLPGDAESVAVLEAGEAFPGGQAAPAIVVFRSDDGLDPAELAAIDRVRERIEAAGPQGVQLPLGPLEQSEDGTAAILVVPIDSAGDEEVLIDAVEQVREIAHDIPAGVVAKVTGPAGYSADASAAFEGINTTLLLATTFIVLALLIVIYRSPVFWVLPLLAVFFAEGLVRAIGTLMADAGVVVNGQTAGILLVLVFGAGTDYALLLTARYREELRVVEDRHEAMRRALVKAGPTIVASAGTVVASLLVLALADVNSIAGLGPVGAMGVAVAALAMLTVLPALLLVGGRRAFWPSIPRFGEATATGRGFWYRLGEVVGRRYRVVWVATTLALGVMALGISSLDDNLTAANGFRGDTESVQGQRLLEQSFPAGASAPTTVLVTDEQVFAAVSEAAEAAPEIASVGPGEQGPPGTRFDVVLTADPFGEEGYGQIGSIREQLRAAGGNAVLVGGATAEEADLRTAVARDTTLLVPLILLTVFVILVALLRALVAPVLLVATVVLSYLAALGVSLVLFEVFADFPGEDPSYPLFAFVFLVALGVDYNIFLMARVREEAASTSTREATLRGLAVTGGVITSAGVVLAGTFLVLSVLPLVALTQIGVTVAIGVLLDTFIVRSLLVPALTLEVGERVWWPSGIVRGRQTIEAAEPAHTR